MSLLYTTSCTTRLCTLQRISNGLTFKHEGLYCCIYLDKTLTNYKSASKMSQVNKPPIGAFILSLPPRKTKITNDSGKNTGNVTESKIIENTSVETSPPISSQVVQKLVHDRDKTKLHMGDNESSGTAESKQSMNRKIPEANLTKEQIKTKNIEQQSAMMKFKLTGPPKSKRPILPVTLLEKVSEAVRQQSNEEKSHTTLSSHKVKGSVIGLMGDIDSSILEIGSVIGLCSDIDNSTNKTGSAVIGPDTGSDSDKTTNKTGSVIGLSSDIDSCKNRTESIIGSGSSCDNSINKTEPFIGLLRDIDHSKNKTQPVIGSDSDADISTIEAGSVIGAAGDHDNHKNTTESSVGSVVESSEVAVKTRMTSSGDCSENEIEVAAHLSCVSVESKTNTSGLSLNNHDSEVDSELLKDSSNSEFNLSNNCKNSMEHVLAAKSTIDYSIQDIIVDHHDLSKEDTKIQQDRGLDTWTEFPFADVDLSENERIVGAELSNDQKYFGESRGRKRKRKRRRRKERKMRKTESDNNGRFILAEEIARIPDINMVENTTSLIKTEDGHKADGLMEDQSLICTSTEVSVMEKEPEILFDDMAISKLFDDETDNNIGKTKEQSKKKTVKNKSSKKKKTKNENDEDEQTPVKKKRPNYFIAVQITNPQIHSVVDDVKKTVLSRNKDLQLAMVPTPTIHLTLMVICLENEEDINRAKVILDKCAERLGPTYDHKMLIMDICGIGHFNDEIVFANVAPGEPLDDLTHIAAMGKRNTRVKRLKDKLRQRGNRQQVLQSMVYLPVKSSWKSNMCRQLQLPLPLESALPTNSSDTASSIQLSQPKLCYQIQADGNCFFSSLSYVLSGSEDYHFVLRNRICDHLQLHSEELKGYLPLEYRGNADEYVRRSRMRNSRTWASEVEIFTACHLMKTNIYIYTKSGVHWKWLRHSSDVTEDNQAIYLFHKNQNHYDVVLSIDNTDALKEFPSGLKSYFTDQLQKDVQIKINERKRSAYESNSDLREEKCKKMKLNYRESKEKKIRTAKSISKIQYNADPQFKENKKRNSKLRSKLKYTTDTQFKENKKRNSKLRSKLKYTTDTQFKEKKTRNSKLRSKLKYTTDPEYKKMKIMTSKLKSKVKYQTDLGYREKKQTISRLTSASKYHSNVQYRQKKKKMLKQRYISNHAYKQYKLFSSVMKYAKDPMFRQHVKNISKKKYKDNLKFREDVKNSSVKKYKDNLKFREDVKKASVKKYKDNEIFREKVKCQSSQKYKRFESFRNRVKASSIKKYSSNPLFRAKLKLFLNSKYHQCTETRKKKKSSVYISRKSIQKAIKTFKKNINDTPNYVCTVCIRTLYKSQVKECKRMKYASNGVLHEVAAKCLTGRYIHKCDENNCPPHCTKSSRSKEWICYTCDRHLLAGNMPPQALANNLFLQPIPEQLKKLNVLEKQLIAMRIPFMKLLALPRGGQRGVKGPVVNVPSDLNTVTTTLPHSIDNSQLVKVKLKRKLSYKGHYQYEWVNPANVIDAVKYLIANNKWYSNIKFNESWFDQSQDTDLVREDTPESDSENEEDAKEDSANATVPVETCFQPLDIGQDFLDTSDKVFCIAPGENQTPQSIFKEEGADAMAFPWLLPDGHFGFSMDREVKLSPSKYFNARLFSADNRFASDNQFVFFAQYVTEINNISSHISIALRKGKDTTDDGKKVTAAMLTNSDNLREILKSDIGFRFLQPIRGTPPYWQRTLKDLYAMIRQLGVPTWFVTFSAAETRWEEVTRTLLTQYDDERNVSEIEWTEKCKLIRENAVTCARLFDHRVKCLFRDLILSPSQPIGEVMDHFFRTEFQQRGSPHIHCLIWIKDAPKLNESSDDEICEFVDKYISCEMPDAEKDPELYEIVKTVQMHNKSHSKSCKKHSDTCRFHFPRPPIRDTFIARMDEEEKETDISKDTEMPSIEEIDDLSKKSSRSAKQILKDIWALISEIETLPDQSFDTVLQLAQVTYEEFQEAIKTVTQRNMIYHKREMTDCWVNNYNKDLLRGWNANLDIQYVMDAYSCVAYILSYISKAETEMGDLLQNAKKDAKEGNADVATAMKEIGNVYMQNREISAQEAVYRACGLHLKECSRDVKFIPTGSNAFKMSLPINVIKARQQSGEDNENIWMASIIDKYYARPDTEQFNNICLADFCSKYTIVSRSKQPKEEHSDQCLPVFELQNGLGYIQQKKSGKESVIRYPRFHKLKQSEEYYMTLVQLYLPSRSPHIKPQQFQTYEEFVRVGMIADGSRVLEVISMNQQRFEVDAENLERAWDDLQEGKIQEDAWALIAPEAESERLGINIEQTNACVDHDFDIEKEDVPELAISKDRHAKSNTSVEYQKPTLTKKQIHESMCKMNADQQEIFYKIRQWCLDVVWKKHPEPFHLFLTGGAGTGKTHLVQCIYHEASRILSKIAESPDSESVLLTAPTGTAAFNVGGSTIHSAFAISKNIKLPYTPLGENILNTLRSKFENLHILIIDEVSMVDHKLLSYVHGRLAQLKQSKKYFGNISVLAVGDFYQLPPVKASPLYRIKDTLFTDLWNPVFSIATLTEIMRQKDLQFASMLNRLRTHRKGQPLSQEDIETLSKVSYQQTPDDAKHVLHIFPTNKEVDQHNQTMLSEVCEPIVSSIAQDYHKDIVTGKICLRDQPYCSQTNEDLPAILKVGVGARVMLARNIDTDDGLVNGAFGTITGLEQDSNGNLKAVYIAFDNSKIGKHRMSKVISTNPLAKTGVRIVPVEDKIHGKNAERKQLPLKLGWAATIHKVQGMTVKDIVVSVQKVFQPGMAYVAFSRSTSLTGLRIINMEHSVIYASEDITKALDSMPRFLPEGTASKGKNGDGISLLFHNTEGLFPHLNDIIHLKVMSDSDIVCFAETWIKKDCHLPASLLPDFKPHVLPRSEAYSVSSPGCSYLSTLDKGGVAIFTKKEIHYTACDFQKTDLEYIAGTIQIPFQFSVVTIYRPPVYAVSSFLGNLQELLTAMDRMNHPIIIVGDFNDDIFSKQPSDIQKMFKQYQYKQLVSQSTTESGSCLDNVYVKSFEKEPVVKVLPLYYSFHEAVQVFIPF